MTSHPTRPLPLAVGGLLALAVAMGIGRFVYPRSGQAMRRIA